MHFNAFLCGNIISLKFKRKRCLFTVKTKPIVPIMIKKHEIAKYKGI